MIESTKKKNEVSRKCVFVEFYLVRIDSQRQASYAMHRDEDFSSPRPRCYRMMIISNKLL